MKKSEPWKHNEQARTCKECGSQRPGMQPLTIFENGKRVRGYWHLKCFDVARSRITKESLHMK